MTQINWQEITNRKKGSNEKVSYQLDALQKTIISLDKQELLLGGQAQNTRNGGLLRITALGGVEMGEKSSGINYSEKKDDLLLKKWVSPDSYLAYTYPTRFFLWNTNQVQPARLISLFKMKIRNTIGTAMFTYSWTNYQNKFFIAYRENGSSHILFYLDCPLRLERIITKRNTQF